MHSPSVRRWRSLVAVAATGAITAGLGVGLSAPSNAAPTVLVTTTLTDSAGNAIEGFVSAVSTTSSVSAQQHVVDGVVSLALEPGSYKFRFSGVDGKYVAEYYTDKTTWETADTVAVAGPTTLAPVQLASNPLVTGVVVGPDGMPVRGADVSLYTVTGEYVTSASAATDGRFAVGAPAGDYKMEIGGSHFRYEWFNDKLDMASADPISLTAAGADAGTIALAEYDSPNSGVSGVVRDAAGVAVPFVDVALYTDEFTRVQTATTDYNGMYEFAMVPTGEYRMRFTDALGGYATEWHSDQPDYASATPVSVTLGTPLTVDATLANDPAWASRDTSNASIAGTVVDSAGRPVVGANVTAYGTPSDGSEPAVETRTQVGRDGQFFLNTNVTSETQFHIRFSPSPNMRPLNADGTFDSAAFVPLGRWAGGTSTLRGSAVIDRGNRDMRITLPLTGGVSGIITSEISRSVRHASANFYSLDGVLKGSVGVRNDGTFAEGQLEPGRYKVLFRDDEIDIDSARDNVPAHAPEWYDDTNFATAKEVTVKSGVVTGSINAALGADLKALRKPAIKGKPFLGKTVTADPGVWTFSEGTNYTYEWLVGDEVLATGPSYAIGSNLKGDRLVLRVTASNGSASGVALVTSQKLALEPKVTIKAKGAKATITIKGKKVKAKKIKGTVVAKIVKKTDDFGNVTYKKVGKAKITNGKTVLTLKKLPKGKTKVTFFIALKGNKLGDVEVTKKIKIKR